MLTIFTHNKGKLILKFVSVLVTIGSLPDKSRYFDAILANQQAIAGECRFVLQDLNRSFPGDIKSKVYEQKRAAELLKATIQYDIVLDFHNTYCPANDCGFVGESACGAKGFLISAQRRPQLVAGKRGRNVSRRRF